MLRELLERLAPARLPGRSLQLWLQSSLLIAVLAGYGLLLAVGAVLTVQDRRSAHRQLVKAVADGLSSGLVSPSQGRFPANAAVEISLTPLAGRAAAQPARLLSQANTIWLESRTPLRRAGKPTVLLVVRQNVTASIQRERTLLLLLIAAAGLASLFTSALLRPVLRRGLVDPIAALCAQLQRINSLAHGVPMLQEAAQPRELQPIAAAFNALQQRLAAAWERERSFTDGVAHELRTPITLISGQAQSLLRQPLPPAQRHSLEAIAREAQHMGTLVRDLLDLAREDAGRLQLLRDSVDPEALILESFDRLRPLAPNRLQLAPAAAVAPPPVRGDRERLVQCLTALVDNALAYAPTGPVELALSQEPGSVIWHVRDRGPGVATEERERIFERFVRGSAAANAARRGSGLGLALVRLLMQAMGGSVVAADHPGGGADFQLRLPLA